MQSFFIYTYGGYGDMIATIFNGMARLFASNSEYFTSVGKLSMSVGAVWAATRAIFNANIGFFGKAWFAPTFLAFTFFFTPKASVIIHDEVANTQHKVDNIPFAIAFFSSTPSIISHYIASQVEEQFKTVDMSSRPNLMFGAKLIARFKEVKVQDPVLLENFKEFMRQCFIRPWIMGNILDKKQAAETTDNLFAFMKANQANNFGMYYKQAGGNVVFKTCVENTEVILTALAKEAKSDKLLSY
jgi:conjugal transfer mating pair stabilization protein TraG